MRNLLLTLFFSSLCSQFALASQPVVTGKTLDVSYQVHELLKGQGTLWGLDFISPEHLLITERRGQLIRFNITTGETHLISGLPDVHAEGQGGLLDVKVSPDFAQTGWIYFTYSKPTEKDADGATTLARAKLNQDELTDWQDLIITLGSNNTTKHYGSRIAFDDQGHVFLTVGDRGHRPNGQDLSSHPGSILRVNLDGSIPTDNPFVSDGKALTAIWSYGHRNAQGISFDPVKKQLWSIEHGPRGGDEINLIESANNYGWPMVSQGKEYWGPMDVGTPDNLPGMTAPVKVYIPSIAPSSLIVYRGKAFPGWDGVLMSGALRGKHLNLVTIDEHNQAVDEARMLTGMDERIRALTTDAQGLIYLTTDSGRVLQIKPAVSPE